VTLDPRIAAVTDRIREEFEEVAREYVDCYDDRSDRTNVWVSRYSNAMRFSTILPPSARCFGSSF